MPSYDVVVAGAGMGGAAFALQAARAGWQVALVERDATRAPLARPEILWGGSLAALDRMGAGARVRAEGALRLLRIEVRDARSDARLFGLEASALADAEPWGTDPARTRQAIVEEAMATGRVDHMPGIEVTGLFLEDGRVAGVRGVASKHEITVQAPFVVADDGAKSAIRDDAAIPLVTEPFPLEFILATAPRPPWLPEGEARAWMDPGGFARRRGIFAAFVAPVSRHRVSLVCGARHGTFDHLAQGPRGGFEAQLRMLLPPTLRLDLDAFPAGFVHAVRPLGHVSSYWRAGVALLGDAAHPVSPVGGQGANMALADAVALAEAILPTTPPGQAPSPKALQAYEARRRAPNERSLAYSRRAAAVLTWLQRAPVLAGPLPWALRALDRSNAQKARLAQAVSHAFQAAPEPAAHPPVVAPLASEP